MAAFRTAVAQLARPFRRQIAAFPLVARGVPCTAGLYHVQALLTSTRYFSGKTAPTSDEASNEAPPSAVDEFNAEMALLFGSGDVDPVVSSGNDQAFWQQLASMPQNSPSRSASPMEMPEVRPEPQYVDTRAAHEAFLEQQLYLQSEKVGAPAEVPAPNLPQRITPVDPSGATVQEPIVVHIHNHHYEGAPKTGSSTTAASPTSQSVTIHIHHHFHVHRAEE